MSESSFVGKGIANLDLRKSVSVAYGGERGIGLFFILLAEINRHSYNFSCVRRGVGKEKSEFGKLYGES